MKLANIDKIILHIFQTIWEISMEFSGKMCFMIISKFTESQGFTLSVENTVSKKSQERQRGANVV